LKKLHVLRVPWLTEAVLELLRRNLEALGIELVVLEPEEVGAIVPDDTVLVLINDALESSPESCAGIEDALSRGARVIGLWPPGQAGGTLPAIIGRRGTGTTTCDGPGLRELVDASETGGETWLAPGGQSMPERLL
jgi:hypothetical protein